MEGLQVPCLVHTNYNPQKFCDKTLCFFVWSCDFRHVGGSQEGSYFLLVQLRDCIDSKPKTGCTKGRVQPCSSSSSLNWNKGTLWVWTKHCQWPQSHPYYLKAGLARTFFSQLELEHSKTIEHDPYFASGYKSLFSFYFLINWRG